MAILCSSWCILVYLIGISLGKCLLREPPDIDAPPQQTDGGFYLEISGNPKYYEPGHLYTVSLTVREICKIKVLPTLFRES